MLLSIPRICADGALAMIVRLLGPRNENWKSLNYSSYIAPFQKSERSNQPVFQPISKFSRLSAA